MEGLFHYSSEISESINSEQTIQIDFRFTSRQSTDSFKNVRLLLDKTLPFEICERIKINLNFHHYNIKKIYTERGADAPPSIIYF